MPRLSTVVITSTVLALVSVPGGMILIAALRKVLGMNVPASAPEDAPRTARPPSGARDALWARLRDAGWNERLTADHPRFVLPASAFFDADMDVGSLAPNLVGVEGAPPPEIFEQVFTEIASEPSVSGVFVSVLSDSEPDSWPSSDMVYVVTAAPLARVKSWVQRLEPDEVREVGELLEIANPFSVPAGQRVYSIWWD
jgi:hypothetical protein